MAGLSVAIPKSLGLSDAEIEQLKVAFSNHLVETMQAQRAEVVAAAKAKAEVVHVEVEAI